MPEVWGVSYHTESHEDVEVLEKFEGMIIGGKKCIETGVSKKRVEVATEERDAMLAILREEKKKAAKVKKSKEREGEINCSGHEK